MKGIIIASFGTTHMDAFEPSIDRIMGDMKGKYPDYYITHAFSSEMVRSALKKRDIHYFNIPEALQDMEEKGILDITIFSLYVIPGVEYEKINKQAKSYNNDKRLKVNFTTPFLNDQEDIENTAQVLRELFNKKPTILVGHGTYVEGDSVYQSLQKKLQEMGTDIYVGTVEGSLDFDAVVENLEGQEKKDLLLTPFLLVAGDHAKNDMASDDEDSWFSQLSAKGYKVETELMGLCERPEINQLFYKKLEEVL